MKQTTGFPEVLGRQGGVVFAFHDRVEVGPRMPAQPAKATGLKPEDLQVEFLMPACQGKRNRLFPGGKVVTSLGTISYGGR